jgi:BTB And C-terminal Kelch
MINHGKSDHDTGAINRSSSAVAIYGYCLLQFPEVV